MRFCESAPAKINLGLSILGKRLDGFHDILSVFQTVGLSDFLCLDSEGDTPLYCSHPTLPTGRGNLILQAEERYNERFGVTGRVYFQLEKRIPVGAGLAGGSSDAAAVLRALGVFHGLDATDSDLAEIGAELGSDVPFMLRGGTAVVSGRGEIVESVQWPFDFTYVIVFPGFGVSTAWAYGSLEALGLKADIYRGMTEALKCGTLDKGSFFNALVNDFEPVVFGKHPRLAKIRDRLIECGASVALLTGSGSSLIGIFEDEFVAHASARSFSDGTSSVFVVRKTPTK